MMPTLLRGTTGHAARIVGAAGLLLACAVPARADILVFAAASLTNVLDEVIAAYPGAAAEPILASYAASSALARQIEQGADADIFLSADLDWMDYLEERSLIRAESRTELLGNSIVLVVPGDSTAGIEIGPGFDLAGLIGDGRMAMADPDVVPAGRYGRQALEHYDVWDAVEPHVARAENVRAALALVALGEAPVGIVYATDAVQEPAVRVLATFPAESHLPIVYPAALTQESDGAAAEFLDFLASPEAGAIFARHGFTVAD